MAAATVGSSEAPEWVTSKIDEVDAEATAGDNKKKRRSRQNFSWSQLSVLERVFETDPLPRQALLLELSSRLDITPRCVQVWFQNRRQKFKAMHHAMGQVPPTLKNASSRLTSLEALLPDLGPEPPRVTADQLRESSPKVRRARSNWGDAGAQRRHSTASALVAKCCACPTRISRVSRGRC